ncbi:MAG: L-ribulose-5-phosphate 4-epimerase [Bacteroidales bacterium]
MDKKLIDDVYNANLDLVNLDLVIFTWGNVSAIDREKGLVVIKPSGIPYEKMSPEDMVVLDLEGNIREGKRKPSSDTPTHIALYKAFDHIGAIVHTHSEWATSWAQAGIPVPPFGTTHADYFHGEVPCTRPLKKEEVEGNYEMETGKIIIETFRSQKLDPIAIPGVLVHGHGPFAWGTDAGNSVQNAKVLEEIAKMAFRTMMLGNTKPVEQFLLDKHYNRKHGKNAYYGQK